LMHYEIAGADAPQGAMYGRGTVIA
jgi:hypothetical protein